MPSGIAAAVRQQVAGADKAGLAIEESRLSRTGYTNVIEVRGKYQARLQVKGSAERKRYQHPLPGPRPSHDSSISPYPVSDGGMLCEVR